MEQGEERMSSRKFLVCCLTLIAGTVIVLGAIALGEMFHDDGIEPGKTYALAYTYKATVKGVPYRVFAFKDRNLPRTDIAVPVQDERGMALVRENPNLPPSTIRKIIAMVPTRRVEGVTYPGYTYVLWEYRMSVKEPQGVVPEITPRK